MIGIEEIKNMIQDNIDNLPDTEESTDGELFSRKMSILSEKWLNNTSKV